MGIETYFSTLSDYSGSSISVFFSDLQTFNIPGVGCKYRACNLPVLCLRYPFLGGNTFKKSFLSIDECHKYKVLK